MQALTSFSPGDRDVIERDLCSMRRRFGGLEALIYYCTRGWFIRFLWPDWPPESDTELRRELDRFHTQHPQMVSAQADSPEWDAAFQGLRADPESATSIARCFGKKEHFGTRLAWVRALRSPRGLVSAVCMIAGVGEVSLHATWRDAWGSPSEALPEGDRSVYESSMSCVAEWARDRVWGVLTPLRSRLEGLYGHRLRGLYVFGSYARPDTGIELPVDSDLDVALILSDFESPYKEIERFSEVTSDLSLEHGLLISLVPIRESDFSEGKTNFIRVISEYAIRV